jgi:hypothetical protein
LAKLFKAKEPVLIVGSPGVGKTDCVRDACEDVGADLIVCHPVVDDATDYKGMPWVAQTPEGPQAGFVPFGMLNRLINADKLTVVFFDDMGQAVPMVQAAAAQLLLARRINGHRVSNHVVFVAATNRRQDKAGVQGMISMLADRFTSVLNKDFDLEDFVAWGLTHDMPAALLAFSRFRPALLNKFDANRDMQKSSTPRSVAGLGRLINMGIDDYEVWEGAVGREFATEFMAFWRTWMDLPDREEIYLNPESAPVPTKPDVLFATMGMLSFGATASNFEATVRYLDRCPHEFATLCVKDSLHKNRKLLTCKAWTQWALAHKEAFGFDAAAA